MLLGHMDNLIVNFIFYYYRSNYINYNNYIHISIQDRAGQYCVHYLYSPTETKQCHIAQENHALSCTKSTNTSAITLTPHELHFLSYYI